jgi:hypothetical protein
MRIFKEKAGVISEKPVWVAIDDCYLYTHDNLFGLIKTLLLEWKHDKHLAGY